MSKGLTLLPPSKDVCQQCAIDHPEGQPHDATSLFYGFWFLENHGRSPTWADAIAHCSSDVKTIWEAMISKAGISLNSVNVRGDITSAEQLDERLRS